MEVKPSSRYRLQQGAALMALIVVLCISGMLLLAWGESKSKAQNLTRQIELGTLQELKHIKASLFAHATVKGLNSLTHPGNMPCPSSTPTATTPASCLSAWLGYLPIESRSAVNHLRLAIHSKPNARSVANDKSWMYAVSPQLIQANELGWSQWVDWTQPSLAVWHNGSIITDVAVVVAEGLEALDGYTVKASGAHVLIRVPELRRAVFKAQEAAVNNTFNTWLNQNQEVFTHENLSWNSQSKTVQPKWSDCQCNCTRTRCNCACNGDSWWVSNSACLLETETCKPLEKWDATTLPKGKQLSHVCNAQGGSPCVFKGSSRLLSAWPVSSTLPVASKGKACENFTFGSCPLSTSNSACACDFNWPSHSKAHLADMDIRVHVNEPNKQAGQ
ncbi:MAG: hypothetical protein QE278_10070 [Limnobacter sp.]|nr:hypothetical protein [Limnobacter sp.]